MVALRAYWEMAKAAASVRRDVNFTTRRPLLRRRIHTGHAALELERLDPRDVPLREGPDKPAGSR